MALDVLRADLSAASHPCGTLSGRPGRPGAARAPHRPAHPKFRSRREDSHLRDKGELRLDELRSRRPESGVTGHLDGDLDQGELFERIRQSQEDFVAVFELLDELGEFGLYFGELGGESVVSF